MGAEPALPDGSSRRSLEMVAEEMIQPFRFRRFHSSVESGTLSLGQARAERELGNHQKTPFLLLVGKVHPARFVLEESHSGDFPDSQLKGGFRVSLFDSEEKEQARTDFGDEIFLDTHTGLQDPLNQDFHRVRVS